MDDNEEGTISVVEVYELAADIGKQCELLIEQYGPESVRGLLPRVVCALEALESGAARQERYATALINLREQVAHLESDKLERAECRQRFEQELEMIEDQWRSETAELVAAVSRLQEENRRLQREKSDGIDIAVSPTESIGYDEQLWRKMGENNEKQRILLREKETQLTDKENVIDGLTAQMKRLAATNREIKRKQKYLLQQMRVVCGQRAELEATSQAKQRELVTLRQALVNEKSGTGNGAEFAEILKERDNLKIQLEELQKKFNELNVEEDEPETEGCDNSVSDDGTNTSQTCDEDPEGPPVQGPLPYEPDDAPWKRQPSGIRKFFRKLFSEYDVSVGSFGGSKPFSSLTNKMAGVATSSDK